MLIKAVLITGIFLGRVTQILDWPSSLAASAELLQQSDTKRSILNALPATADTFTSRNSSLVQQLEMFLGGGLPNPSKQQSRAKLPYALIWHLWVKFLTYSSKILTEIKKPVQLGYN